MSLQRGHRYPALSSRRAVIGGCGRTGAAIAAAIAAAGRIVYVLDVLPSAFDKLPPDDVRDGVIRARLCDITLESQLIVAGVQDADMFIAVGGSDPVNAVAAQIAHHVLRIPDVICRLDDPVKREMYERLNICAISPTRVLRDLAMERFQRAGG